MFGAEISHYDQVSDARSPVAEMVQQERGPGIAVAVCLERGVGEHT